jgi:hypothetical protein
MDNIFLATPRDTELNEATYIAELIKENTGAEVVHLAQTEFESHFANCGGWQQWAEFVATSRDFTTRKPRYEAIVCISEEVGRATADIVKKALAYGKPCFIWKFQALSPIVSVEDTDPENWKSGWRLYYSD